MRLPTFARATVILGGRNSDRPIVFDCPVMRTPRIVLPALVLATFALTAALVYTQSRPVPERAANKLYGGAGNDKLNGGTGKNRYSGGSGNDVISAAKVCFLVS